MKISIGLFFLLTVSGFCLSPEIYRHLDKLQKFSQSFTEDSEQRFFNPCPWNGGFMGLSWGMRFSTAAAEMTGKVKGLHRSNGRVTLEFPTVYGGVQGSVFLQFTNYELDLVAIKIVHDEATAVSVKNELSRIYGRPVFFNDESEPAWMDLKGDTMIAFDNEAQEDGSSSIVLFHIPLKTVRKIAGEKLKLLF
jgi:hypothetical protein